MCIRDRSIDGAPYSIACTDEWLWSFPFGPSPARSSVLLPHPINVMTKTMTNNCFMLCSSVLPLPLSGGRLQNYRQFPVPYACPLQPFGYVALTLAKTTQFLNIRRNRQKIFSSLPWSMDWSFQVRLYAHESYR